MLDLAAFVVRLAEDLQRLVLGRGGEGEVAGVGQQLARLHDAVDLCPRWSRRLLPPRPADSAMLIAAEVLPPWLECASSMMMAKLPAAMLARRSRRG